MYWINDQNLFKSIFLPAGNFTVRFSDSNKLARHTDVKKIFMNLSFKQESFFTKIHILVNLDARENLNGVRLPKNHYSEYEREHYVGSATKLYLEAVLYKKIITN